MCLFFVSDNIAGTRIIFFRPLITIQKSRAYLLNLDQLFTVFSEVYALSILRYQAITLFLFSLFCGFSLKFYLVETCITV